MNNFILEKDTGKVVLIDTEYFPALVGMKEKRTFKNYISWYGYLTRKFIKESAFRNKKERYALQQTSSDHVVI